MKKISVVICTYNQPVLLINAIESLHNQSIAPNRYEIIVVDNNSDKQTRKIIQNKCREIENARVVTENMQGLSHARNRGIKEASYELIGFIDDDAIVDHNWVKTVLANFREISPQPSVMGGKILPWFEKEPPKWYYKELDQISWGNKPKFLQGRKAKSGFSGSNIIFRKDVLAKFAGFNTKLGMVADSIGLGEETELCMRIYKHEPYFYYDPNLIVKHFTPVKKMTISYLIKRAYVGGKTSYWVSNNRNSLAIMTRELVKLIGFSMISIFATIFYPFPTRFQKRLFVRSLIELSVAIGWLVERFSKNNYN